MLVIGPEKADPVGQLEKATERAASARGRLPIGAANSALMLKRTRTPSAPMARRYRRASPAEGLQSPISLA